MKKIILSHCVNSFRDAVVQADMVFNILVKFSVLFLNKLYIDAIPLLRCDVSCAVGF